MGNYFYTWNQAISTIYNHGHRNMLLFKYVNSSCMIKIVYDIHDVKVDKLEVPKDHKQNKIGGCLLWPWNK